MRQVLLIILTFLLFSCESDKEDIEKVIDSDILVSTLIESENVYIEAETVKEYVCITYSIEYLLETDNNNMTIHFTDVVKPDGCFHAFGPAETKINLGNLEAGDYSVMFKLNGITTEANLTVNTISTLSISKEQNVRIKK